MAKVIKQTSSKEIVVEKQVLTGITLELTPTEAIVLQALIGRATSLTLVSKVYDSLAEIFGSTSGRKIFKLNPHGCGVYNMDDEHYEKEIANILERVRV